MVSALYVCLGLVVGLLGSRHRQVSLFLFALPLALFGALFASLMVPLPLSGALLLGAGVSALLLLTRLLPRLFVLQVLVLAALTSPLLFTSPRPALIGTATALGVAAIVLTIKADLGLRVACAMLGAKLLLAAFSLPHPKLLWAGAALALLAGATLLRRQQAAPPTPWGTVAASALLAGALLPAAIAVAFFSAPELPASGPFAARQAKVRAAAPHGGLVWPLPSEAMTWADDVRGEFPHFPNLDALYLGGAPRGFAKLPGTTLRGRLSLTFPVVALRTIKDADELSRLRAAALASVRALREALPLYRPGTREEAIGEAIRAGHLRAGCSGESFPPIAASGPSAAQPHGSGNKGTLEAGQLVVTDIGCYFGGYASDFTRTIPVGGRFSERQRKLYDAVYAAQQAALAACRPGVTIGGRKDPKSLEGIARATIAARGLEDHNPFGIGHSVGLFVHDPVLPSDKQLKAGMVITIEPGIYLEGELGIRIEDTYLVTEKGCEPLTVGFPADADSVEALLRGVQAAGTVK
jgi:hypothetical protein